MDSAPSAPAPPTYPAAPRHRAPDPALDAALGADLRTLERAGLHRSLRRVEGRSGAEIEVEGRRVVDFASNDYLGLASDPRLSAATSDALGSSGTGGAAARLISGNHPLHEALEAEVAALKGLEAALLFPTGYAANTGAIPALADRGDVIYADRLNHASLIDGCRLSRADTRIFAHADLAALDSLLRSDRGRYRRRWIVADAVFSMDGDLFPLAEAVGLARRHGAWIYLDDAHGTGVLGDGGGGLPEAAGVLGEVEVVMGTLGKALGASGAFVAGSPRLRDWLLNRARPFVFSTAPPPALAAAAIEALRIVREEPERRERLRTGARRLREGLACLGRPVPGPADGHVIPLVVGGSGATVQLGRALLERGFLVGAVRPPTVPPGTSRLRLTVSAAHGVEAIDGLLDTLAALLARP
jgi:8-amino-7-oxononanoate synthase